MSLLGKRLGLSQLIEKVEERPTVRVFKIKTDLSAFAVAKLEQFADYARRQKSSELKHVVLDFSAVANIDFSAVAVLVRTLNDYKKFHRMFALSGLHGQPQSIFDLAKVSRLFPSYPNALDATRDLELRF